MLFKEGASSSIYFATLVRTSSWSAFCCASFMLSPKMVPRSLSMPSRTCSCAGAARLRPHAGGVLSLPDPLPPPDLKAVSSGR